MGQKELISKQTRTAFRDYFSDCEVLRTIRDAFDAADIACDDSFQPKAGGERRNLVEQYCHTLDLTKMADARKLLDVYRGVLAGLEDQVEARADLIWETDADRERRLNTHRDRLRVLTNLLKRDGWVYASREVRAAAGDQGLEDLERHADAFDLAHIRREIERIKQSVDQDPGHAIGTAKELVESCCKTILNDFDEVPGKNDDVMKLVKATARHLELTPDDIPESRRGADSIRNLLQKLGGVAHELAELRNLYGSGHGKDGKFKGLQPRHARLAVGMAGTLTTFLFETHEARKDTDGRPI